MKEDRQFVLTDWNHIFKIYRKQECMYSHTSDRTCLVFVNLERETT